MKKGDQKISHTVFYVRYYLLKWTEYIKDVMYICVEAKTRYTYHGNNKFRTYL